MTIEEVFTYEGGGGIYGKK